MIGGELQLIASLVPLLGDSHYASAIDQYMQRASGLHKPASELIDRGRIGQIQLFQLGTGNRSKRRLGLIRRACGHNDLRTGFRQHSRGFKAKAGIAAGNNGGFTA
ncbi:hypothetical protein D3C81_1671700 [compost metagenome]